MPFHAFATGRFLGSGLEARCVLGKGGTISADLKREGDGASPIGVWPIRGVLYRADRIPAPETALPTHALEPDDGWCDAADDPNYNRPIKHPYSASAEKLWREDHAYDVIVILGYNDVPVVPGAGSAIFWHLAQPDWRGTEGCVAVSVETMLAALKAAKPGDSLSILD